jgi:hypothetical protein
MTMTPMTGIENRRSPRVLKRVALCIDQGTGSKHEAFSAVINTHGALVIAPLGFPDDTVILVENLANGQVSRARVVWSGGEEDGTGFKMGLEFLDGVDFWGEDYDPDAA